jgi:hypothetical protein
VDEPEAKFFEIIKKYGWHVMQVSNVIGESGPTFSYSTGIYRNFAKPELIVYGLSKNLEKSVINSYGDDVRNGHRAFSAGAYFDGFLEGFDVTFIEANEEARTKFACWSDWFYERQPFPMLQLVYPTTSGAWPWEDRASDDFRSAQPLFGDYRVCLS